ncbi:hypothetical protein AVEN_248861-1 [Araneus ventricosus]|uniref:Uncharacterized protein n=1 Tax=Araneus ventricosus TaxID=182803 RepID=A0A4Y2SS19_ARAVE|nr:hypothetical protein AVEN_248861-1 [Araneus ventricosus]
MGDADHYIFSCSLTKEFHLIKPADEHKKAWFNNLLTNRQAVTKMEGAFRTSRNICDTRTLKTSLESVMVSLLGQCIANVPVGPESAFHFGDTQVKNINLFSFFSNNQAAIYIL